MNATQSHTFPTEVRVMRVILAQPRGFCAGVVRAIDTVEHALQRHGAPVYVRHEIVHNKHVVNSLKAKGAIFVEELDEVPADAVAVFSAHGVSAAVENDARHRDLRVLTWQGYNILGSMHGGTAQLHQQAIFRPVPGLGRPETPVRRLYLASASAHPGGGVTGAPGHNAAHAFLSDRRLWTRRH